MKKVIFMIAFLSLSAAGMAQSNKEEIDLMQSVFGMEKKAFVASFIELEGTQGDTFWQLYDEYETERKELGKKRLSLLGKYAESYASLDEATTGEILSEMISLQTGTDKLISSYAKKIKKEVDVKTAAQFYQIEGYILSKIRTEILENIPVIGKVGDM